MKTAPSPLRGGLLAKLLLVIVVLFVVLALAWALLLPSLVVSTIRAKTGFVVAIDRLSINPFTAKAHLSGVVLQNPDTWPEKAFVDLRDFRADAELLPLLRGKLIADEVTVDVAQVTLVKNKEGALNAVVFKDGLAGPADQTAGQPKEPAQKAEFLIRRLNVKFDRLVYADHSGRSPGVRNYDLGINTELRDVDSVTDLLSPFRGAALAAVTESVGKMLKDPTQLLENAGGLLKDGTKKAGETLKGLMQSLEKKGP